MSTVKPARDLRNNTELAVGNDCRSSPRETMIFFRKPSPATVRAFLERQSLADFSYRALGCTRGTAPAGWYRAPLGVGGKAFSDACQALSAWTMFDLGWVEAHPAAAEIAAGTNVAVLIQRRAGVWWLNGARIVYVHDSTIDDRQFGFAYGTLADHAECGEERFWIVRDRDEQVWFELTAMSRPTKWFVRAGLPLVRRLQRRFAADVQAPWPTCGGRSIVTAAVLRVPIRCRERVIPATIKRLGRSRLEAQGMIKRQAPHHQAAVGNQTP